MSRKTESEKRLEKGIYFCIIFLLFSTISYNIELYIFAVSFLVATLVIAIYSLGLAVYSLGPKEEIDESGWL